MLGPIAGSTDAEAASYRIAAQVLSARIGRARGDKGAIDAVIASLRNQPGGNAPVLVYSPPFPRPTDPSYNGSTLDGVADGITRPVDVNGLQWVDIGFAIRADGSVATPEVLRGSKKAGWAEPLLAMIAGRRYTPTGGDESAPGRYRVERYTLTADFGTPVGSLIRRRIYNPRYQQLDLTDDAPRKSG